MNSSGFLEAAAQGTVSQDGIELRSAKNGTSFASFSIAIATGKQDDAGKNLLTWLRVTAFGEAAEILARRAKKGARIYAEGRLELSEWVARDGVKRSGLNLTAWKCELIGAANIGRNKPPRPRARSTQPDAQGFTGAQQGPRDYWHDEMPF